MDPNKDYYKVLGLNNDASEADIKRAFHRLAKKYHPDLHPDDKNAEARFKEISEAHEILSDPKKKAEYDELRKYGAGGGPFFTGGRRYPGGVSGPDIGWEESFIGGRRSRFGNISEILNQFFNIGGESRNVPSRGADLQARIEIPFELAITGGKTDFSFRSTTQGERKISVKIPAGITNGGKIRLRGLGESGQSGAPPGDLILTVYISKHRFFRRIGDDIYADVHINLKQAIRGSKIRIRIPSGEKAEINIPAGTQPGTKLKIRGKGVRRNGKSGDLFIVVNVDLPKNLSKKAQSKFDDFVEEAGL